VLGIWSRLSAREHDLKYAWIPALLLVSSSCAFLALELLRYLLSGGTVDRRTLVLLCVACAGAVALAVGGACLSLVEHIEPRSELGRFLGPWPDDPQFLRIGMWVWLLATLMLLLGLWTKPAAIASYAMSISFANLNDKIDNAGDTIRIIIQFYLMLCPCGAVWSLDRLLLRLRGKDAPVVLVSPWPIRMLFVQLIFIYFINGVYKMFGGSWREGYSLFYVMGDFTLTRFSLSDNPLPLWAMRLANWSVLFWEASFPVLVINRWTRLVALCFGVFFHLGIFVSMELGFFVPYTLCIYLPLLPWERLSRARVFHKNPPCPTS
jgi:uncharacterized membrane protein YphA (DoxX/SURF4 family)